MTNPDKLCGSWRIKIDGNKLTFPNLTRPLHIAAQSCYVSLSLVLLHIARKTVNQMMLFSFPLLSVCFFSHNWIL